MSIKVGVVGAAGFAGIELVRLLQQHPLFEVAVITSNADAGTPLAQAYPAFCGTSDLVFETHDTPALAACDAVFLAVPHTAAMGQVPALLAAGTSVFDLSADYRLKDAAVYEKWYGTPHTSPDLLARAAFGLPELFGAEVARAAAAQAAGTPALVACAGCYPTATSLAAFPAVNAGLMGPGNLIVNAISGVSGAGKSSNARTHFCTADENVEAYGVGKHRHTPEIEQILGLEGRVLFTPHLAPLVRGLLSTVYIPLCADAARDFDADRLQKLYTDFYADAAFVHVLAPGTWPKTRSVAGSCHAHIGLTLHEPSRTLIAVAAIDNLCKGAAGQAVQCANIVYGFEETTGLAQMALPV
ncbi:MAG: N-acetyl-gamma-glutamyl-phosphate reductase [Raoultibacter sp.]